MLESLCGLQDTVKVYAFAFDTTSAFLAMLPVLNKKAVHNCMHYPYPHMHCIIFYENNQQSALKLLPLKQTHGVFPEDRFFPHILG